jgi:hypothetical protein
MRKWRQLSRNWRHEIPFDARLLAMSPILLRFDLGFWIYEIRKLVADYLHGLQPEAGTASAGGP